MLHPCKKAEGVLHIRVDIDRGFSVLSTAGKLAKTVILEILGLFVIHILKKQLFKKDDRFCRRFHNEMIVFQKN